MSNYTACSECGYSLELDNKEIEINECECCSKTLCQDCTSILDNLTLCNECFTDSKINEIEEKLKLFLKEAYSINHQYYKVNGKIYYSASGHIEEDEEFANEFDKAVERLIKQNIIKEIKSKYKGTRMFNLHDEHLYK